MSAAVICELELYECGLTISAILKLNATLSLRKPEEMQDLAKGLPYGWRVELKIRKTGTRVGQKYKCYISPVTGCKFYSKGEVSRYLKSRPKVERNVLTQSESHVVIERKDSVDGLPPGWTVKLKVTRKGDRIRTDPYYTDPMTGYVFRSRKDVLRYLKSGELGNYAFKPKEGDFKDVEQMDEKTSPSSTAKKQRHLPTVQTTISIEAVKNGHALESSTTGGISPSGYGSDQCEENTDLSSLTSLEVESSKRRKGKKVAAKKVLLSLPPMTVPSSEKQLLVNGAEEHERKPPLGSKNRKYKKELDIPRRVSKRLAEVNAKLAANVESPSATCQAASMQPPEPKLAANSSSGRQSHSVPEQSNQLESEKAGTFISFATTGEEPSEEGCHVGTQEQVKTACGNRGEEPHKQGLFCIGIEEQATGHRMPEPVYDQATHGKVEIETKADQKLESTLQLPFGGSWPDPSLEFAFKTLTGGEITEFSSIASLEIKSSTRRNGKKFATENAFLSVPPTTVPSSEKPLLENGLEEHGRKPPVGSRKRKDRKKELDIPRRVSKRLAEVNARLTSDIEGPSSICQEATMQPTEAKLAVNSTSGSRSRSVSEQPNQLESEKEGNSIFYATTGEEPFKQEGYHGSRGEEPHRQGLFCIGREEQATELRMPQPIWDQAPLGEFEVEMKADQKLESTLQLPFGDSWHQSLEFAFKTLTGAIPLEGGLVVQNCFQQQLTFTLLSEKFCKKPLVSNLNFLCVAGGEITELVTLASLETESSNRRKGKKVASKKVLLSVPPTTVPSSEKLLLENRLEEHERETERVSRKGRKEKELDIPRRVSKRLAEVKASLALDKEKPNSEQLNQLQFEKAGISMSHATTGEEPPKQERYHVGTKEQTDTAHRSRGKEHVKQGVSCVGREEETTKLEVPRALCNQATLANVEIETNADQLESTLQLPFGGSWPDPSLEFAFKTLTGAIPVENCFTVQDCFQHQVSSNLQFPFGDSWPDPSLEFAFKTLTGAIPVEDSLAVQEYLQHQQNSAHSQNNRLELPGFSIDNFRQTDNYFQFESMVKPGSPNQLHKPKAPVSTSASVVASTNNVVQRQEENADCKRREMNP
ncbi:hypothetical protein IFM89_037400 [Coptis chinensis]|uniref:MBD domain-containing protein n=1 Tax=Coptis chinensis TaxID=261450 RepID=A0A835M2T9_9MAGN|nr:hypothetical protein IFM89_037400 [Coptis chinensis]